MLRANGSRAPFGVLVGVLVQLLGPTLTTSTNACAAAQHNTSLVEITLAGEAPEVARVRRVVRELLESNGIETRWNQSRTLDPHRVLMRQTDGDAVHIWIDISNASVARVYLARSDGERIVVRRIPLAEGLDETARELIGQIVQSSALALANGASIGMTRDEASRIIDATLNAAGQTEANPTTKAAPDAPPPGTISADSVVAQHPVPPRSPTALVHYGVGLGYAAQAFSAGPNMEHGPNFLSVLGLGRGHARLLLRLDVQYHVPVSVAKGPVELRLDGIAGHLQIGIELRTSQNWWFGATAGIGGDFVHALPERTSDSSLTLSPETRFWMPAARTTFVSGVRVLAGLDLVFSAFSDFGLERVHFDIREGSGTTQALTPFQIRPGAGIGLLFVH